MAQSASSTLCYNLAARSYSRGLTRLYDRHLAGEAITSSQFSILAVIARRPAISVADLATTMVMERTTLMRALHPLEDSGLIVRDFQGRRKIELSLTPVGEAKLERVKPLWAEAQTAVEAASGEGEAGALRDLMLKHIYDHSQ